jgi:hypothetical protein
MGIGSLFGHLVKGKVLAMTAAGAILLGGTTAAMASTSTGQEIIHTITGAHDTKPTGQHTPGGQRPDDATTGKKGTSADNHKRECPHKRELKGSELPKWVMRSWPVAHLEARL